jgi:dihydroorotase-like cyclic amidohydrolase
MRALQYAATFGYTVWLRPQDGWLGKGVAASGAVATRLGLSGVPVAAETLALHTIVRAGARHRRPGAPVPAVQRGRRRTAAPGQGARACRSRPT